MYQHIIQHNLMRKSGPPRGAGMVIIKRASNRADAQCGKKLNRRVDVQSINNALSTKETEQAQTLAMQRRLPYNLVDTVMKIHRSTVAADDPSPLRYTVVSFLSQYTSKRPSPFCPAYSSCHDSTGLLSMHPWSCSITICCFPTGPGECVRCWQRQTFADSAASWLTHFSCSVLHFGSAHGTE